MSSSPSFASQTKFVTDEFDTTVTDGDITAVIETITNAVNRLRTQIDDDTLDSLLRADTGSYKLRESMTRDNLQPEPFTQDAIIEPLFGALGYDVDPEASGLSRDRSERADYTVSLREYDTIDSTRLLIEAEPVNKHLETRGHGVNQVESWLSQREFESDYGYATDGLRWVFIRYDPDTYTHDRIEYVDLSEVFLAVFENMVGANRPVEEIAEDHYDVLESFLVTFKFENFTAIATDARRIIKETQKSITDEFYDDYIRYVFGVVTEDVDVDEERAARSLIGDGVISPDDAEPDETRLFAVKVMNRLIFIKFLEDKHIVRPDLLQTIKSTYDDGVYPDTLYKTFIEKLFFDVMNTKADARSTQIESISLFDNIPYLNGGLFRPYIGEDQDLDERRFDVRDTVLESIIELLERYAFSADGGPGDLDPSVLGNVFEKTINYLTSDPGDQNKELGAYYTPSEITRFCAEETVRPALLERYKTVLEEERGWPEYELDNYDTVYELIEALPGSMDTIGPLLDETNEFRVVDPGMGSGHFLTSVLEEIVAIRKALYAQQESYPHEFRLKKTTVQNNIYGVDIVGPAVEIGKLRLWLSIIAELDEEDVDEFKQTDLALPNIAFNLRQGNSLVGYTGFPDTTDDGDAYTLNSFTEDSVRRRYQDIIDEIRQYEEAGEQGFAERAEQHRHAAFEQLETARSELIPDIHNEFVAAGVDDIAQDDVAAFDPFNWVLEFAEVYADGGFDVVVGNPPWDRIKPNREDFFSRYDPAFRTLRGDTKDERQEELLNDPTIREAWEQYQREIEIRATYFNEGPAYEMQEATVAGRTEASENDLSSLFFERVFDIAHEDGYVSQVLPGRIFHGAPTKTLRQHLMDNTTVYSLVSFENHGIFDNIDNRYNFGVLTFKNTGSTDTLRGIFQARDLDILQDQSQLINIPRQVLTDFAPSSMLFPRIQDKRDVGVLEACVSHPAISDEARAWYANPTRPLDKSADSERFFDDPDGCDYPILTGRNFYSYNHDSTFIDDLDGPFQWSVNEDVNQDRSAKYRIREKKLGQLKRGVFEAFDGSGSMIGFVNELLNDHRDEELSADDVRGPWTTYRAGFRRVARGTDEQSLIAAVVPPGPVCDYSFYVIDPFSINPTEDDLSNTPLHSAYDPVFTDEELFAALGLLNSLPFDFMIRRKIDNSIPQYSFKETQTPDLTDGDEWFKYIWTRAARLNCYGDAFEEMRDRLDITAATNTEERKQLRAEIDAAAMHAYGIADEQAEFIVEEFHRVNDPRIRTESYFELVLEKFRELTETVEIEG